MNFFEKKEDFKPWLLMVVMLITGLFVAVPNKLNAYLAGVIDAVVFFPLVNGGNLILSTLSALIIFKEKLTKKQWFGVAFGLASFACLCFLISKRRVKTHTSFYRFYFSTRIGYIMSFIINCNMFCEIEQYKAVMVKKGYIF